MTSSLRYGLTPKMKPVSPRRSAILCVLDIGTSKIVCMIVRLRPRTGSDVLPNRSHRAEVIGFGHTRSRGIKAGGVADMLAAEAAIRQAVHAAEEMAQVQVASVIVTVSAGRLASEYYQAEVKVPGPKIDERDIQRVLATASDHSVRQGRAVLHSMPTGFAIESTRNIKDPRGMLGEMLGVDMHVVTTDIAIARNLMLCVERCYLTVEAMVAAPFSSALAVLTDDEAELGTVVIDMGAGTTTMSVFTSGQFVHSDGLALGGHHVTMDVARGLSIGLSEAERLKVLHGAAFSCKSDERDMLTTSSMAEDDRDHHNTISRAQLISIIRPRVDETLELVRDRLHNAGVAGESGRRVLLTGGAAQLPGLADRASHILGRQVRVARPVGIAGLPEAGKGPAFAAAVGLTVYPQIAGHEHFETRRSMFGGTGGDGYFAQVGKWLKAGF